MEDKNKNQPLICNTARLCDNKRCYHKTSHYMRYKEDESRGCLYMIRNKIISNETIKCIPNIPKKRAKRYSLKELYNLWIEWTEKYNIPVQKFYEQYGLPGSFIKWLEEREKK